MDDERGAVMLLRACAISLLIGGLLATTGYAHFVWLVIDSEASTAAVVFSEAGEPGDPDLLGRLRVERVRRLPAAMPGEDFALLRDGAAFRASLPRSGAPAAVCADTTFGTMTRGDTTFLLRYWAKAFDGPMEGWRDVDTSAEQRLDIHSDGVSRAHALTVRWDGAPAPKAEVVILTAGGERHELEADDTGSFVVPLDGVGRYAVRARVVDPTPGEHEGVAYGDARHYSTLTFHVRGEERDGLPSLPEALTSFGAAILDDSVYVYGGHQGAPHSYHVEAQSPDLLRLDLANPSGWERLEGGPRLQGLALVAHGGKVYRLGGFTALNRDGEDARLVSQTGFSVYDPKAGTWEDLAPMPVARSSFDAAVLGDSVYAVGGWQMTPGGEPRWLDSAFVADLSADEIVWEELPTPPFHRRALSVAAHDGEIWVCGGMDRDEGPTTEVSVYDPAQRRWRKGPALNDSGRMAGFGSAAFAMGGRLYVTAYDGALQVLAPDGGSWDRLEGLDQGRFFHRMLPVRDRSLLVVAGANMTTGSYADLVVLTPESAEKPERGTSTRDL